MSERVNEDRLRDMAANGYHGDAGRAIDEEAKAMAEELLERRAADTWLTEPSEGGAVWVKGESGVFACMKDEAGTWCVTKCIAEDGCRALFPDWTPLNGRQVRQIRRGESE